MRYDAVLARVHFGLSGLAVSAVEDKHVPDCGIPRVRIGPIQ
jgi:hypothetical protein